MLLLSLILGVPFLRVALAVPLGDTPIIGNSTTVATVHDVSSLTTLVVYAPQSSASPASAYQETGSPTAAGPAALAGLTSSFLLSDPASTDLATTGSDTPAASPSGYAPAVNAPADSPAASATDPKHSGDLGRAQAGTRMGLLGLVWGVLAMGVL